MTSPRTALVTGGNRGIGAAICRGLAEGGMRVLLGARDPALGDAAAGAMAGNGLPVTPVVIDTGDPASITACVRDLAREDIAVDILVNNAAVYPPGDLLALDQAVLSEAFAVNTFGPLRLIQALAPAMVRRGWGRIVNLSSEYGALSDGLEGPAAYSLSKAALNAITLRLGRELPATVKVNAMCPGWVNTRMGGAGAPRTPEQGADTAIWLATLPDDGPTGGFFRDRRPIPW